MFNFGAVFSVGNWQSIIYTVYKQEVQTLYQDYFFSGSGFFCPLIYAITGYRNPNPGIYIQILTTLKMCLRMSLKSIQKTMGNYQ